MPWQVCWQVDRSRSSKWTFQSWQYLLQGYFAVCINRICYFSNVHNTSALELSMWHHIKYTSVFPTMACQDVCCYRGNTLDIYCIYCTGTWAAALVCCSGFCSVVLGSGLIYWFAVLGLGLLCWFLGFCTGCCTGLLYWVQGCCTGFRAAGLGSGPLYWVAAMGSGLLALVLTKPLAAAARALR